MAKKPMTTKDKIREWISDNLRYMLLGLAILLIVGLITLLVHLLSSSGETSAEDTKNPPAAVSASVESQEAEPVVKSESEPQTEAASATSISEEPLSASSVSEEEAVPEFTENNRMDVTALCTSYYEALGKKDIEGLKKLVDTLSEEEEAIILADSEVAGFRDISVYTMPGLTEGTYIAFARYTCMYNNIVTGLPTLSEIYVYTTAEGTLKVMENPENDEAIMKAMLDAQNDPEVVKLIEQVTTNYEIALENDPALENLVAKLS